MNRNGTPTLTNVLAAFKRFEGVVTDGVVPIAQGRDQETSQISRPANGSDCAVNSSEIDDKSFGVTHPVEFPRPMKRRDPGV
ncbi:hypothetical protein JG687_00016127 [Phytophthora cactorum]|uniref:Uncharacterized protein n=1 Tax=Phytophthora cactorum TaxID=29920 RepID=A0A8T1TV11_9STRA|nr:hypothetical protein GQ600_16118 [Phytophthora cactorum]KAG6947388.1 hypothetical protein JG687_00016127 [Phytophthora cactorum]